MSNAPMQPARPLLTFAALVLIVSIVACGIPAAPTPARSNAAPGSIETIIHLTAGAAQTQTLQALPDTATPAPTPSLTRTPTRTPTPTETVIIILPSATPTATDTPGPLQVGSGCELVSQSPANNEVVARKANFDAQLTFKNTGSEIWEQADYDFEYLSGEKIYKVKRYDLTASVEPQGEVTFVVKMKAPEAKGTYSTTWGLVSGNSTVCKVTMTIEVE